MGSFVHSSAIMLLPLVLAVVLGSVLGKSPEEGDHFEGDIILDEDESMYNAIRNSRSFWPNGRVPYRVDSSITSRERSTLMAAIADYNRYTCIRWVPRTTESAYVSIVKGGGCSSQVGTTGRTQRLTLGRGCWNKGIVIHEMMHAVGFWHEQSRSDRDSYVTIVTQNINPRMRYNFNKMSSSQVNNIDRYDYGSIMHYGPMAFSANRQPTIVPKQKGARIGQRAGFSQLDIKKINILYKCGKTGGGGGPRPTSSSCRDNHRNCRYWARVGECKRNPNYMLTRCKKSCRRC